jgi:hypothetical protein
MDKQFDENGVAPKAATLSEDLSLLPSNEIH